MLAGNQNAYYISLLNTHQRAGAKAIFMFTDARDSLTGENGTGN